jgi:two-component system, NarL family, sensor histidine kinase UhpB
MRLRDLHNSVTARLVASAFAVLLVVIAGTTAAELLEAPSRIDAETRSSTALAEMIIGYALGSLSAAASPDEAVEQLVRQLGTTRHVDIQYVPQGNNPRSLPDEPRSHAHRAPGWFVALLVGPPSRAVYPVIVGGVARGTLAVTAYGYDEIDEIWSELCREISELTLIVLLLSAALGWVARHALRPIEAVADGMDRMCRGEFTPLDDTEIYELRRLGERFNTLAASLQSASIDNRMLIDRMMTIQESEREEIARTLHDEVGSTLFSIRAGLMTLRISYPEDCVAADNVGELETMIEEVQSRNRRLLERLRPMVLDHLSLADALRDMVDAWDGRTEATRWVSEIDDDIGSGDGAADVAIYRIVQECLTNVARHAHAGWVTVLLRRDHTTRRLEAEISDDGIGLPKGMRYGYGLMGAAERARKFGGEFHLDCSERGGTIVRFGLPVRAPDPTEAGVQ